MEFYIFREFSARVFSMGIQQVGKRNVDRLFMKYRE